MSPKADGMQIQWCYLKNERISDGSRIRYVGFRKMYYDGPFYCFGFWFYNIILEPMGSNTYYVYDYRKALEEVIKINPEMHLLSDNETVREYAQNYLKTREIVEELFEESKDEH